MFDDLITFFSFWNAEFFMSVIFPIASLVVSTIVAISFWLTDWRKDKNHQKDVKESINNNVRHLTTIYNRLYAEVDELEDNVVQAMEKAQSLSLFFARNMTRLEILRLNIENQLVLLKGNKEYTDRIKKILEHADLIIEKCNRPDIPERYQLSLWRENRIPIQENTTAVITLARSLKIINNQ